MPKGFGSRAVGGNYRFFGWRQVTTPNEPNGVLLDSHQSTADSGSVTLRISDSDSEIVRTLEETAAPGLHRVIWDRRDDDGGPVTPGTYAVTLDFRGIGNTRQVIVKPSGVSPRK